MEGTRVSLDRLVEWRVPQYPRLSPDAVRFSNKLNRQALNSLEFTSGGQPYILSPDTTMPSSEFPVAVQCSINGHSVRLGFDSGLCDFLLSDWLPLEDIATLPDNLKKSIITAILNPVADFFVKHSAGSFNVVDIECQSAEPPPASLFFNLSSTSKSIVGRMFASTDEHTVDTLDKIWQVAAKPESLNNTAELPVWVEVIACGTALSLDEFGKLSEDDIILLDIAFSDLKEVYARISDDICFLSIIDGNKLIIQKRGEVVMASGEKPSIDQEIEDKAIDEQEADALDVDQASFTGEEVHDTEPSDEESIGESLSSAGLSDDVDQASFTGEEVHDVEPSDNQEGKQTTAQLNNLGDLPVELLFVVDQFKTTMKEIEQIKPGYVFELNTKMIGRAEIRANGIPIGTGELVQIEDHAGVRILKLYGQTKADE